MGNDYKLMYAEMDKKGKYQLKVYISCIFCKRVMRRKMFSKHRCNIWKVKNKWM